MQNQYTKTETKLVETQIIPSLSSLGEIKSLFKEMRINAIKISASNKDIYNDYKVNYDNAVNDINNVKKNLCTIITCPAKFDQLLANYNVIIEKDIIENIIKNSDTNPNAIKDAAKIVKEKLVPLGIEADQILDDLKTKQSNTSKEILILIEDATNPTTVIVITVIALLINAFILSWLSHKITNRISSLVKESTLIAEGDLTVKVNTEGADEISFFAKHFKALVESITDIVVKMHEDANTLADSSNELKKANVSISQASDDVLAQVMSVGAASEEMVSVSEDVAKNCNVAAQSSEEARTVASEGMSVVHQTVANIRRHSGKTLEDAKLISNLGEETSKIDTIISTIQDIASQTNLLALNAAIEAARAGEHGRGFAVVADEVRALAARTGESTKEISEMISNVQSDVKIAGDSINQTVGQMEQIAGEAESIQSNLEIITQKVSEVNSQITQIATATEEQTATSSEMSRNIQKITEFAQQVSDQAKDTCKNTSQIEDLSLSMTEQIGKFKF